MNYWVGWWLRTWLENGDHEIPSSPLVTCPVAPDCGHADSLAFIFLLLYWETLSVRSTTMCIHLCTSQEWIVKGRLPWWNSSHRAPWVQIPWNATGLRPSSLNRSSDTAVSLLRPCWGADMWESNPSSGSRAHIVGHGKGVTKRLVKCFRNTTQWRQAYL